MPAETHNAAPQRLRLWEHATEWPLIAAATLFLSVYAWEVIADLQGADRRIPETVMNTVWVIFAVDYCVRLVLASHRRRWFARHLPDLAMVALPMLRPLRLVRLLTLIGVLQRSAGTALRGRITAYTAGSAALLSFVASLVVLDAERAAPGASITTFPDALWWSLVTITTVGYGDLAPVTTVGRWTAVLLMIGGVAMIGIVTATLASWIVSLVTEENAAQEAATQAQVAALQEQLAALSEQLHGALEPTSGDNNPHPDHDGAPAAGGRGSDELLRLDSNQQPSD
ncbi:potassium channel family protein [Actinomyces sp. MRS3W]|uniref:potassium channel family protein n=1 Tax=Actinomyces sp. MRS3W TaxID=2800796 RepID=UPI0028FD5078|nr:potassium channel family protein [Actinomyces sp. MRS3W]MDU0348124.1 potassium channel family protein [Actinomyces sp. MRS3W]